MLTRCGMLSLALAPATREYLQQAGDVTLIGGSANHELQHGISLWRTVF